MSHLPADVHRRLESATVMVPLDPVNVKRELVALARGAGPLSDRDRIIIGAAIGHMSNAYAMRAVQHVVRRLRIDRGADGRALSKAAQVRMCGNSVCPPLAEAIVRANYSERQALREAA